MSLLLMEFIKLSISSVDKVSGNCFLIFGVSNSFVGLFSKFVSNCKKLKKLLRPEIILDWDDAFTSLEIVKTNFFNSLCFMFSGDFWL